MRVEWTVVPIDVDEIPENPDFVFAADVPEEDLEGLGENAQAAVVDDFVEEAFREKLKLIWRKA